MIIIELPIVYLYNYDEVEKAKETGVEIEKKEDVTITTFFIPDNCLIRVNAQGDTKRTTIVLDKESYGVDADYETVLEIIKRGLRKNIAEKNTVEN